MFKKITAILLVLISISVSLSAASDLKTAFPALHRETNSVFPVDSALGQTVSPSSTPVHSFLAGAFSEEYSFDWAEKYFDVETKSPLASVFSSFLSSVLPCNSVMYSKAFNNPDGTVSVLVKFESGRTATFAVRDNKIFAVSPD